MRLGVDESGSVGARQHPVYARHPLVGELWHEADLRAHDHGERAYGHARSTRLTEVDATEEVQAEDVRDQLAGGHARALDVCTHHGGEGHAQGCSLKSCVLSITSVRRKPSAR